MNMLKKGPELKVSDLKVPDFALDIYYDLKERHLLPLVAILLVALVALPIVLSSGSDSNEGETATATATPSSLPRTSALVVAKAAPGLRNYHHRLAGTYKDPFKQQYTELEGEEEGVGSASSGEESGASVEGAPETTVPSGGEGGGAPVENGEPPKGGHLQYYSFAIDVRITPVSSKKQEKSTVRHSLPNMTMLPSRKVPAFTFVSVTKDEKNAVMLISDKVTGLFGDATCIEGSERCQLLALEPGIPETVVYGADARTYRITLLKLRLLKTDKLNTAPLAPSKGNGSGSQRAERPSVQPVSVGPVTAP
jgi:hypothetical protein